MSKDFDINKAVAEFLSQRMDSIAEAGKGVFRGAADKVRLQLKSTYSDYLKSLLNRYSKTKSFFIRDVPTYLYYFYVPLDLKVKKAKFKEPGIEAIAEITNFAVITGLAGCGKSTFMKHLLLSAMAVKDKIPVFIELRAFNDANYTLMEMLSETFVTHQLKVDIGYIEQALDAGHFLLLLDGFDEVVNENRKDIRKQIHLFADKYSSNQIILASRPETEFYGWDRFTVFEILPLSLEKASSLIQKIEFDIEVRSQFVTDLEDRLFKSHKSFLSNPLLLSIMLLTYSENANIPRKMSLFYLQAFEALFHKHDALKSGFERTRRTELDIQEFSRAFSSFSMLTFRKRILRFTRGEAIEFAELGKELNHLKYKSAHFVDDVLKSVCLFVEDGLSISYTHRSFQEFFVALFIRDSSNELQTKLLSALDGRNQVVKLLFEMSPDIVEKRLILPELEKFFGEIVPKREITATLFAKLYKRIIRNIEVTTDLELRSVGYTVNNTLFSFITHQYFNINFASLDLVHEESTDVETMRLVQKRGKYFANTLSWELDIEKLGIRNKFFKEKMLKGYITGDLLMRLYKLKIDLDQKYSDNSINELLGI